MTVPHALWDKTLMVEETPIRIVVGYACNNNCVSCGGKYQDCTVPRIGEDPIEPPPEDEIFGAIETAVAKGQRQLEFLGGEPTLSPSFCRILDYLDGRIPHLSVVTNGRKFQDKTFALFCVEKGLKGICISLNGSTAEIHNRITRRSRSFKETVEGIRNLVTLRESGHELSLSVATVFVAYNLADLPDLGVLLRTLGITSWRLKYAEGCAHMLPYSSVLSSFREVVRKNAAFPQLGVEGVPLCLLDDLISYSKDPWRAGQRPARKEHRLRGVYYSAFAIHPDTDSTLQKGGPTRCDECVAFDSCGRISAEYYARYGDEELSPFGADAWRTITRNLVSFGPAGSSDEKETGDTGVQNDSSQPPIDRLELLRAVCEAAKEEDWRTVYRKVLGVLVNHPNNPNAIRLKRLAEAHLLDEHAASLFRAGRNRHAQRLLDIIRKRYGDVTRSTG